MSEDEKTKADTISVDALVNYTEPNETQPCSQCKYRQHDTALGELWCNHTPAPDGIKERLTVDTWGHCGYWKPSIFYNAWLNAFCGTEATSLNRLKRLTT